MTNTLGLEGDMDDVELILDLERAFAVKFSDETTSWYTVGDIHAALLGRFELCGDSDGACATAMAFYRIRRRLTGSPGGPKMRVDAQVPLPEKGRAGRLIHRLQNDTGLKMPRCEWTLLGMIGATVLILGIVAILPAHIAGFTLWAPLMLAGLGLAMCKLDPMALPDDCLTLGQLASKVARLNRGALIDQGAAIRLSDIWHDLVEVLSEHTELPKSEMRADTLLLQPRGRQSR